MTRTVLESHPRTGQSFKIGHSKMHCHPERRGTLCSTLSRNLVFTLRRRGPALLRRRYLGPSSQSSKSCHCHQQRESRSHSSPDSIQQRFIARFVLRRLYALRFHFQLKHPDLVLLLGNLLLLIGNLFLQRSGHRRLPVLLPALFHRLPVSLNPLIAGIAHILNEAIGFSWNSRL